MKSSALLLPFFVTFSIARIIERPGLIEEELHGSGEAVEEYGSGEGEHFEGVCRVTCSEQDNASDCPNLYTSFTPTDNLTYTDLLRKIRSTCFSAADIEALYGNKAPYGTVVYIAHVLIRAALGQIGSNELRKAYNLKPKAIQRDCDKGEELECPVSGIMEKDLDVLFKQNIYLLNDCSRSSNYIYQEDVDKAVKFIDSRFGGIRALYQTAFDAINDRSLNRPNLCRGFSQLLEIHEHCTDALINAVIQFTKRIQTPDNRCYTK